MKSSWDKQVLFSAVLGIKIREPAVRNWRRGYNLLNSVAAQKHRDLDITNNIVKFKWKLSLRYYYFYPVRCKKLYKWSSFQMMLHFSIRILALWNKLHKTVRRCYWYTLLLRSIELYLIYKEDLTTNLPRCWYNCAASTTLLVGFYPDSCLLWSYYTWFEHVQNKRVRSVVLPDHKDTTSTLLRLWRPNKASTTIHQDRGGAAGGNHTRNMYIQSSL